MIRIPQWHVEGFYGGDRSIVGIATAFCEYKLMGCPSPAYAPFMRSVREKALLLKTTIELLQVGTIAYAFLRLCGSGLRCLSCVHMSLVGVMAVSRPLLFKGDFYAMLPETLEATVTVPRQSAPKPLKAAKRAEQTCPAKPRQHDTTSGNLGRNASDDQLEVRKGDRSFDRTAERSRRSLTAMTKLPPNPTTPASRKTATCHPP